jgi:lysophospholipase L1-like esterase
VRDALAVIAAGAMLALVLEGGARWLDIGAPERPELPPKRSDVFRILALGGSTVQGVPDGDFGFVTQLALGLPTLSGEREIEILNLARSGASSAEVRDLLGAGLAAEPDLVILLTGHNEFLAPHATRGLAGWLQRTRDASYLARALSARADATSADPAAPVPTVGPELREDVLDAFARNLDRIVETAGRAGVPLLLLTAPANLADWPPAHRHLAPDPSHDDPRVAFAHFQRGRGLRDQGRASDARAQFELALERDPVPRRAVRRQNEAVRAHARRSGVRVVDVVEHFQRIARDGLVGLELIADNCHPTPRGNAVIAQRIAAALSEQGWGLARETAIGEPEDWLARARRRVGGPELQARSQLRWLLSNAIYAMKTPFFNFEASRHYLERARSLAPGDWRIHANLGTLGLLQGDEGAGRRALARAEQLKGEPLDPTDRHLTPYLAEALTGEWRPSSAGGS